MNPVETQVPNAELERLQAKVRKLAEEKSNLQLIIRLIEQINPLPGIDDLVRTLLHSIPETIGGTDIKLYFWIEDELHYADFTGQRKILPAIDDPLVAAVANRRAFLEQRMEASDSLLLGDLPPDVWTWIFPLIVGDLLIGIVKIENLNCPAAPLRNYLPIFFSHAALILSNEIRSHTRRQAEEALRQKTEELDNYFNTALDLFCIADIQGNFRVLNPAWQQVLGYAIPDLEGHSFLKLVHPDDLDATMNAISELSAQHPVLNFINRYRHKDGSYRWIEWRSQSNGDLIYAAARDITERKQAEEEIRRWNLELEERVIQRTAELEASHAKLEQAYDELKATQSQLLQQDKMASIGQLAAGVAHEINNPMGFITSNLNTLRQYSEALREYAQGVNAEMGNGNDNLRIRLDELGQRLDLAFILDDLGPLISESQEGAQRVRAIVQNLKSFSHVDEAAMQFANLNDCLDSTVNIAWNELKYKASVIKEYDPALPPVECWPQQINQVFLNLLLNAVQAMGTSGEIRLRTQRDSDNVVITIADNGCGIPPDFVARIFEPFFTTKPVGQGTGLGLSICYDIVNKHNGSITVSSTPDIGTTFTIRLPIKINPDKPQP